MTLEQADGWRNRKTLVLSRAEPTSLPWEQTGRAIATTPLEIERARAADLGVELKLIT